MIDPLDAKPAAQRSKRRWIIAAVALVIVAAAAIALGLYVHWRDSPNLFDSAGNISGVDALPLGQTEVFTPAIQTRADRTVDLRSVAPLIQMNSAQATVSVVLCQKRPDGDNLGGGGLSDLQADCATISTFRPGHYRLQFNSTTQLFVEITNHRAGTVRIKGFRVRYNDGARRGNQVTGLEVYATSH